MNKANLELVFTGIVLVATTAVATNSVQLPYAVLSSPYTAVVLVLLSLAAVAFSPALGIVMFVYTAVVLFKRNVDTTVRLRNRVSEPYSDAETPSFTTSDSMYGEESIANQAKKDARPFESQSSQPRSYDQFQETNQSNPALGPIQEGFEPAPYGDEQGAPLEEMYPVGEQRASSSPDSRDYMYRPDPDTGSNTFTRAGPDIDEKKAALTY